MNISKAKVLPLLVGVLSSLLFFLLDIVFIDLSMHDAFHLGIDPLLGLNRDIPSFQGVNGDFLEIVEKVFVVDLVVSFLEEVVLVRVIVLDGDSAPATAAWLLT